MATALFQVVIVAMSGSVALLADTVHNFSDALTALPLWLAFTLGRRSPNQRYTYGYGRAEDLAGALIVVMIFGSALVVFYESYQKIIHPQPLAYLGWVATAAVVGFVGNEVVDHLLPTEDSHQIAEEVRHTLFHALPVLAEATVHVDPCGPGSENAHHITEHHRRLSSA
jgi:divalent metal cation (Fe/Co/Zn/Cd) transporter